MTHAFPTMSSSPLVSIIVPTKNSGEFLGNCLRSIKEQTYPHIETIVVDNHSSDDTQAIAKTFTDLVFAQGPERSAQRNYGVKQSSGEYVLIIDSDMELTPLVVEQCVEQFTANPEVGGLVIPEESFGEGFWAQCKALERSFYVGVPWMEAARAFRKELYVKLGGYDEAMVSGEDWDMSMRTELLSKISRIKAWIRHNEGKPELIKLLLKKYYYAQNFKRFTKKRDEHTNLSTKQINIIYRYKLFFSSFHIFKNPRIGMGMLFLKTAEFVLGAIGMLLSRKLNV